MTLLQFGIIAVCAYLLGSLSFAIIVCKLTMGKDIRDFGSGNAGLTNAYRTMGAQKTLGVLLGDIAKGAAAVAIGALVATNVPLGKLLAGIFVILGHMFPVYFGFRGGKGVLVGAVMLAIIDWRIFAVAFGLFLITVIITRWVSLGSILGAASFPISMYIIYHDGVMTGIAFGLAVAVIFMHRSNIMRILHGTENRFTFKRQAPAPVEKTAALDLTDAAATASGEAVPETAPIAPASEDISTTATAPEEADNA